LCPVALLYQLCPVAFLYQLCPVAYLYFSRLPWGSAARMYVSYTPCFEVGCTPIIRRSVVSTGQLKVIFCVIKSHCNFVIPPVWEGPSLWWCKVNTVPRYWWLWLQERQGTYKVTSSLFLVTIVAVGKKKVLYVLYECL
jgi:hypothetical protein